VFHRLRMSSALLILALQAKFGVPLTPVVLQGVPLLAEVEVLWLPYLEGELGQEEVLR